MMQVCPESWRSIAEPGRWDWIRRDYADVWALLEADRWAFDADGRARPTAPPPLSPDHPPPVETFEPGGPPARLDDPDTGRPLARVIGPPGDGASDRGPWLIAVPGAPVAVNEVPVVAQPLRAADYVQAGPCCYLVDQDDNGRPCRWRLRPLKPIAGYGVRARGLKHRTLGGAAGLDLDIPPGQFVGIAAPSGVGKTTLMKVLAGFEAPKAGSVDWLPHPDDDADAALAAGLAPQEDVVPTDLPPREALKFAGQLRGLEPESAERAARRALREMRLGDLADDPRPIRQLSGGQRHRLSLASEFLTDTAPLLFLDEPTTGLDPRVAGELVRHLRARARRGQTIVFTTHELALYGECDRVIILARTRASPADGQEATRTIVSADASPEALRVAGADLAEAIAARFADVEANSPSPRTPPDARAIPDDTQTVRRDRIWLPFGPAFNAVRQRLWARFRPAWNGDWRLLLLLPALVTIAIYLAELSRPMAQYLAAIAVLWIGMNDAVLSIVDQQHVWFRERHIGLRPAAMLAGHAVHHAARAVIQVAVVAVVALGLHYPAGFDADSLVGAAGWPAATGWALALIALLLTAWAGNAFGLGISALVLLTSEPERRPVRAQQWLAFLLLGQILLTVQVADDPNPYPAPAGPGPGALFGAAHATASMWGHELLKAAGDPVGPGAADLRWPAVLRGAGALIGLGLVGHAAAYAGLRRGSPR